MAGSSMCRYHQTFWLCSPARGRRCRSIRATVDIRALDDVRCGRPSCRASISRCIPPSAYEVAAITLYAARGRLIPFNSNSPTGSAFTASSTLVHRNALLPSRSFRTGLALPMGYLAQNGRPRGSTNAKAKQRKMALRRADRSGSRARVCAFTTGGDRYLHVLAKSRRQRTMLREIVKRERLIVMRSGLCEFAKAQQGGAHHASPDHEGAC